MIGLKSLLESEVNLNSIDNNDKSALHAAVHSGFEDIIIVLLDAGADYNLADRWGITPWIAALNLDNSTIHNYLIKRQNISNQSTNKKDTNKLSHKASGRASRQSVSVASEESNISENNSFSLTGPELIRACKLGMTNWVVVLLDKGVDIE